MVEQLNAVDSHISNYISHLEGHLEDMDEKIHSLEAVNTQQVQLIWNIIESYKCLHFCHNQENQGAPMGHVRSVFGRGTSGEKSSPELENNTALPVPEPRHGIQLGGHHGQVMQECARCQVLALPAGFPEV